MALLELAKWDARLVIPDFPKISGIDYKVYSLESTKQFELGGVEWEITLKKKPRRLTYSFPIESLNLKSYYQPALTEEFKQEECDLWTPTHIITKDGQEFFRPENIVGSHAVYHRSKRNNQYKCGKIFHLPRPHLIDVLGNKAWAEYNRNPLLDGFLSVTLPQDFLDNAVYPVVVDPTFGKNDLGASDSSGSAINKWGTNYQETNGTGGTVTQISIGIGSVASCDVKIGCYDLVSNSQTANPNNLLYGSAAITPAGTEQFTHHDLAGDDQFSISANTWYWLGWRIELEASTRIRYDSGASNSEKWNVNAWADPWSNPFGTPTNRNLQWSIYATYTVVGQQLFTLINMMEY